MNTPEQRRFSRIRFHSGATLSIGNRETACEVLDLSLKGALLRPLDAFDAALGERCLLELRLDGEEAVVRMEGEVAHREAGRIGLTSREIDLDSITHLRRLLELNLGDAALLQREFSALISD
ncbi:PilZ domain-containing protein [Pseudothauera nasutitermitis]|uniref:Cyclic diguanosine monophosphate-binding protein n=1 Tax=Pseudothauera nasutitermitis TaxID=2565930 RepID=A0A4S4AND0_9RHOO|nr:PilZ domain-containing protein [Pseudothauera nasutitermitis]THF61144.1 PilZ domain-containing protein [Pseudothauera nasutitermitis]